LSLGYFNRGASFTVCLRFPGVAKSMAAIFSLLALTLCSSSPEHLWWIDFF